MLDTHSGFFYQVKACEREHRHERSKKPELLKQQLKWLQVRTVASNQVEKKNHEFFFFSERKYKLSVEEGTIIHKAHAL